MDRVKGSNLSNENESKQREEIFSLLKRSPLDNESLMKNLGLFLNRQSLSRILFINELYQKIINTHGVIIEFGVRWGQNLSLFENLRGIYEPYNYTRKIIGFDTFKGFPSVHLKDGNKSFIKENSYDVTNNYEEYLEKILDYHEKESPLSHIKKYELVTGDAILKIDEYLDKNPHTIIALAYFDFDLYEPTKKCLEKIKNRLTKGSVIGFDELCHEDFPGETLALKEVLGIENVRLQRCQYNPTTSFLIVE